MKSLYKFLVEQLFGRRNLLRLHDKRVFNPCLWGVLLHAAAKWPSMLPTGWKPKLIFDIGSNIGKVAEELALLYSPDLIVLVEPNMKLYPALKIRNFGVRHRIFTSAVGRNNGSAKFNIIYKGVTDNMASSSLLDLSSRASKLWGLKQTESVEVPIRTLDSIFQECGLSRLDLLKIDIQGYELEAFAGGTETLRNTQVIVTEVSFFEEYNDQPLFHEVYTFLNSAGFELRGTYGFSYDDRGSPLQCDAVFINRKRQRLGI